jgi:hypothetical protein
MTIEIKTVRDLLEILGDDLDKEIFIFDYSIEDAVQIDSVEVRAGEIIIK